MVHANLEVEKSTVQGNKEATMNFIFAHSDLVEASTMQGVIYNIDTEITNALMQIHWRSLPGRAEFKREAYSKPLKHMSPPLPKSYAGVV